MTADRHVPLRWVAGALVLLGAFTYLTGFTTSPDDASIAVQAIASCMLVSMLIGVIVFCVFVQRRHVGVPLVGWPGWKRVLLELLIAAPIAIAWAFALSALSALSPELRRLADVSETVYRPVIIAPVIYCVAGFTLAPLAEEMLYRAVLYRTLRQWMRPFLAVVFQALVFSLMHRYGLLYMAMAFASALLFMGLYLWRGTLWSPILVHSLTNALGAVSLLVLLLSASGDAILGVRLADGQEPPGATVQWVIPGSPAQEADLQPGDVITTIDYLEILQANDVKAFVARHKHGDSIQVTFRRGGQAQDVEVTLRARRPSVLW